VNSLVLGAFHLVTQVDINVVLLLHITKNRMTFVSTCVIEWKTPIITITSSLFLVLFLYVLFSTRYYHPPPLLILPFRSKNIGASSIILVCDGGYRDGIGTASMKNCRCSWRHVKALLITFFWNASVSPRYDRLFRSFVKIVWSSLDSCMRVFIAIILSMF